MRRRYAHGKRDPHSYRLTPKGGITTGPSEKRDKRTANRALRARVRAWLVCDEPDYQPAPPPALRQVSNVWSMNKDGKSYWNQDVIASPTKSRRPHLLWQR